MQPSLHFDAERQASRRRIEDLHPADRFKMMFGLTTGPTQDHERTEADEAAEQTRQRCNKLPFEELIQEPIGEPPEETNGTRITRENRTLCNDLTNEQRAELLEDAMQMIHGSKADQLECGSEGSS